MSLERSTRVDWVTVYGYKRWHRARQQLLVGPGKATVAALAAMPGCTLIEGSGEQVPAHLVDVDGLYADPAALRPLSALRARVPIARERAVEAGPAVERRHA
jgi:hypothetical protein